MGKGGSNQPWEWNRRQSLGHPQDGHLDCPRCQQSWPHLRGGIGIGRSAPLWLLGMLAQNNLTTYLKNTAETGSCQPASQLWHTRPRGRPERELWRANKASLGRATCSSTGAVGQRRAPQPSSAAMWASTSSGAMLGFTRARDFARVVLSRVAPCKASQQAAAVQQRSQQSVKPCKQSTVARSDPPRGQRPYHANDRKRLIGHHKQFHQPRWLGERGLEILQLHKLLAGGIPAHANVLR
jgi:hypothetical protein